jgi:hypothetical protein
MKNLALILAILFLNFSAFAFVDDPKYCNGQVIKDSWGSYYPNGQKLSDNRGSYFPNGTLVKDDRGVYYPNGQTLKDSWDSYYPNHQKIKDSRGVYFHNGQIAKDSWGCYFSNGQKMEPCQEIVTARMSISQNLFLDYTLNTTTGQFSNLQFEENVSNTRTRYQLSVDGNILNVIVSCDIIQIKI